jgi:hypothetical protein
MRTMSITSISIRFPVGGIPKSSPRGVPLETKPSAMNSAADFARREQPNRDDVITRIAARDRSEATSVVAG